jgi:hypothetical protein
MSKFWTFLTRQDDPDRLVRLLMAWRLWLAAALVGALLGWGAYALFPPPYRAQAEVVVDHNIEEAWKFFPERQLFKFLSRESFKLETIAYDDATLQQVADSVGDTNIAQLHQKTLKLGQPMDGVWHFWADDPDPQRAQKLAATWAAAFVSHVQDGVVIEQELEAKRAELNAIYTAAPDTDPLTLTPLLNEIDQLIEHSQGISPYLEVSLTQGKQIPVAPAVSLSLYLLGGSLTGALLVFAFGLFTSPADNTKE